MEKLSYEQIKLGDGYASEELRDEVPNGEEVYVSFAYTDYGGDFIDEVVIEYFKKNYKDNIAYESTCYSGQNGIIWGVPAKEFLEAYANYPLGFEDLEEFYSNLEYEKKTDHIEYMKRDLLGELGIECDWTDLQESNQDRLWDCLYDHTDFDTDGRTMYTRLGRAIEDLKLGEPKYKMNWDEFHKRQGQKIFDFNKEV